MSDWKIAAAKRQAERNAKLEIRPPAVSRRNTKRWCRGRVGIDHDPKCVSYNDLKNATYAPGWKVLVCGKCGKQLDHWWPSPWRPNNDQPPAWVS